MSYDVIASQPIVIDNVGSREMEIPLYHSPSTIITYVQGSGVIKAGFAGEDYPKVHFNS